MTGNELVERPDRRLIEEVLPLKEISFESVREKNLFRGHISMLHVWWARRPLAACRAALLGTLIRDPGDDAKRRQLLDFLVEFCKWSASNDEKLVKEARQLVNPLAGGAPKVLDCFAGGGAIPLEALRIGCDTYSLELNPVAVLIELCTLVYPQKYGGSHEISTKHATLKGEVKDVVSNRLAYDIEFWGNWILREMREECGHFYSASSEDVPRAFIWARTVTCPNNACRADVPLIRQLWLAKKAKRKIALKLIPNKRTRVINFQVVESSKLDFDPDVGTMRKGSAKCPVCDTPITSEYLKEKSTSGNVGERQVVVVSSNSGAGAEYRLPTAEDDVIFESARAAIQELQKNEKGRLSLVPNELISRDWPRTILLPLYGLTNWGQMFNPRQQLVLVKFVAKIHEAYEKIMSEHDKEYATAITSYLAIILDKVADHGSKGSIWQNLSGKGGSTFGRQALPIVWDYTEVNPLATLSGGWQSMQETVLSVLGNIPGDQPCDVRQGTATALPYEDAFFDAIVTDPPYYSAVPYADLSDFFYVWLRRSVGFLYPALFATPATPKGPEIVEQMPHSSLKKRKDKAFFEREMTKALLEMNRVLKPTGVCTIVFAHKTTAAWETLIGALIGAGFSVTSSWPLHTERKTRLRAQKSAALASSVWLVCRKRNALAGVGSWKSVQVELDKKVKERLDHFLEEGIRGADALLSAIGPALEVFAKYERVEKVTGEQVTAAEFLDKVREVVAHHALTVVLSERELGKLDPETAFYVLWKWTYEPRSSGEESAPEQPVVPDDEEETEKNANESLAVPFDDALKLARSVGAEIEVLLHTKALLKQEGEYVSLLGLPERGKVPGLGETSRGGLPPPVIDMIHKSLNLWADQEYAKLDGYLMTSGAQTNDTFSRVAQALSNLLPLQSREKQLIDGLLSRGAGGTGGKEPSKGSRTLDEYTGDGEEE